MGSGGKPGGSRLGRSLPDMAVCARDQMRGLGASSGLEALGGGLGGAGLEDVLRSPASDTPGEILPLELSRSLIRTESSAASVNGQRRVRIAGLDSRTGRGHVQYGQFAEAGTSGHLKTLGTTMAMLWMKQPRIFGTLPSLPRDNQPHDVNKSHLGTVSDEDARKHCQ